MLGEIYRTSERISMHWVGHCGSRAAVPVAVEILWAFLENVRKRSQGAHRISTQMLESKFN
jgi:hypothetical protein